MSIFRGYVRFFILLVVVPALALVISSGAGRAQVAAQQYDTTLKQMLDAIQDKSYEPFVARGDLRFKNGFTTTMFTELSRQLGPRLRQGYSMTFLTTLHQRDYMVYVWKLAFKDNKDDLLVNMAIKDGNVTGFIAR
ncbi:MAG: hypothetical protein WA946_14450 [Nitrospirota bacterium]